MTEKDYGGSTSYGTKNTFSNAPINEIKNTKKGMNKSKINNKSDNTSDNGSGKEEDNFIKAGKIASEVVKYAKSIIKKDMKLLDIAEKIESKITELKGKPAFPCNLSINETAAHFTPSYNDTTLASGLLKVDIGVHINGCIADTAFSMDLENTEENKKLIEAAQSALSNAIKLVKENNSTSLSAIGKAIETSIKSFNLQPIQNLSGHSIEEYDLHSGITIPNIDNSNNKILEPGCYAIEPFSTNGLGSVRDGRPSGIYQFRKPGSVRDTLAREVLEFIAEEYRTLPFCSRWIYKKFNSRGLLALRQIEQAGLLYQYPQLIEKGNGKVAQAEHTILITDKERIVTTE